jgi:hypothetical protein
MRNKLPTQLMDQKTIEFRDPDNPAKIAWNFFTSLYFKGGGAPWGPIGLSPGSCYMGITFYHGLGSANPMMFTSLVQAFDEQCSVGQTSNGIQKNMSLERRISSWRMPISSLTLRSRNIPRR